MFNPILVPLDGSLLAECVLQHSIAIAQAFDARIILLRVLEKNHPNGSTQIFDLINWQIKKTEAKLYLEKVRTGLLKSKLQIESNVLEGLVAQSITEYAQSQGVKLIILSSHGRSGVSQWGISSIAQKIILSAPTSLLIVRAQLFGDQPGELTEIPVYQHILVPLDGSQRAENVLPIITRLAHFHKLQVHLVQVVQTPEMARQMPPAREDIDLADQVVARNREEAGRYLEQVKARSYLEGIDVHTHLITSDNAATALHQLGEQENIDMVTLSAHGYTGNLQWPYGSMVNNFILYGKAPLLIVQDMPAKHEQKPLEMLSKDRVEH
ncbi:MAG: universal stress protein [Anaerolineales bacterium]|jgi:nucleotide-binding universal stress UspA family protein